ncbi:MAG: putative esterase [Planctomycetaceae bacterium]|nr:putative esterase [Planctomycetaceae bacterium]
MDGPSNLNLVRNALDNLTVSTNPKRKLPPLVVIAVENGGNDGKGSERGLEYDTMSDRFARFINDEVLPAVLNNQAVKTAYPNFKFTDDPSGKGAMGCSSGGAAALTMGWFRPDLFRRLITYSGTFVDQQDDDAPEEATYPLGAWEYHSSKKLIENSDKKPLRIFTHVSENDNRANDPEETYHNWVMANERTAAALKAKGYDSDQEVKEWIRDSFNVGEMCDGIVIVDFDGVGHRNGKGPARDFFKRYKALFGEPPHMCHF